MQQVMLTLLVVLGVIILINATTWPIKTIGVACIALGFVLDKKFITFFQKKSK